MNKSLFARLSGVCAACLAMMLAGACSALRPATTPPPSFHSLDRAQVKADMAPRASEPVSGAAPTLIVNPTHAAAGFDSQRIIYVRTAHKVEYFAHSEWVDTPARMLAPLIVAAIENSGSFRAVVLTPSAAAGDLRLDTEIIRLQHDFSSQPSQVRFTLRAYVVDNSTRRVIGWHEFDEIVPAASEDPGGGVVAANQAVQAVLKQLARFCADMVENWQRAAAEVPKRSAGIPAVR